MSSIKDELLKLGLKGILIAVLIAICLIGILNLVYPQVSVSEYATIVVIISLLISLVIIGFSKKKTNEN